MRCADHHRALQEEQNASALWEASGHSRLSGVETGAGAGAGAAAAPPPAGWDGATSPQRFANGSGSASTASWCDRTTCPCLDRWSRAPDSAAAAALLLHVLVHNVCAVLLPPTPMVSPSASCFCGSHHTNFRKSHASLQAKAVLAQEQD